MTNCKDVQEDSLADLALRIKAEHVAVATAAMCDSLGGSTDLQQWLERRKKWSLNAATGFNCLDIRNLP